jgi:hypothetical protein
MTSAMFIFQSDRRRTIRGHCGARVLLRGRRLTLHPTDPRVCQSLSFKWRRPSGSQGKAARERKDDNPRRRRHLSLNI